MARVDQTFLHKLKDRYLYLESERWPYLSRWMEHADYVMPGKANLAMRFAPGQKMTQKLYDSTAIHANEILASTMAGAMTNRTMRWFMLKFRNPRLNDVKAAAEWIDECTEDLYFAMADSNFYSEIHENYLDLGAFATCSLLIDEDDNPGSFRFTAVNVGDYCVIEDHRRRVHGIFRKVLMSAAQIVDQWGKTAPSAETVRLAESSEKDRRVEVLHAIMPREGGRQGRGVLAEDMPYACYYFEYDTLALLKESGYQEWPIPTSRWRKSSGEPYGRGPTDTALPDIKTLNKVVEEKLMAAPLSMRPPLLVPEGGVIGKVRLTPAALNVVRTSLPGGGQHFNPPIKPLLTGSEFKVPELLEDRLEQKIYRVYYYDLFTLPDNGPQMTAREVTIRDERNQRALGPTVGRLEDEHFNPTIKRCFGIRFRAGLLPPPPREVMRAIQEGSGQIDIEYQGPLARAQRSGDAMAIERWASLWIKAAVEMQDPSVLDVANFDEMGWHTAETTGVPSKVMHSKDEVIGIRKTRSDAAARQQAINERLAGSEEMRNKAPFLKAKGDAAANAGPTRALPAPSDEAMGMM
jgi:hypothetical protein